MKRQRQLLPYLLLLLLAPFASAETIAGKVVSVADGDTITVLQDETQFKIRLHGIDAPESNQDFGTAAKNFAADHCFGDVVTVAVTDTDRYGRKVGLVILKDGRVLNHELVAAGLAHWYRVYAPRDTALKHLEAEAKAAGRGLWSRPDVVLPENFRKGEGRGSRPPYNPPSADASRDGAPPGDPAGTVYITDSGAKYHKKGCRFLKNSSTPLPLEEAKRRYEACGVCGP